MTSYQLVHYDVGNVICYVIIITSGKRQLQYNMYWEICVEKYAGLRAVSFLISTCYYCRLVQCSVYQCNCLAGIQLTSNVKWYNSSGYTS